VRYLPQRQEKHYTDMPVQRWIIDDRYWDELADGTSLNDCYGMS